MADDIRIEITGDNKDIKKVIKASEKLVKRFEKANARSTQRRVTNEKRAAISIQKAEEQKNRRLEAMDRRLSRKRARVRLRGMKENIRIAKREAAAELRIKRRNAAKLSKFSRFGLAGVGLGVAGVVIAARDMAKFDLQLTRASAQAGVSVKRQMELRDAIMKTSLAYGTSREEILSGIAAIVDKSGDLEFGAFMMEKMSKAAIGLGVNMGDLGLFATSLKTGLGATNKEAAEFLEILAAQADIGAITIREFAALGPKLFGAAAAAGVRGKKGVIDFGALIQVAGRTGSPEEAVTAVTNLLAEIPKRYEAIEKVTKRDVFKGGEQRSSLKIIKEIIESTGGSQKKLLAIGFGKRAIKPIQLLAAAYRNAKTEAEKFEILDKLILMGGTATESIAAKHARAAETSAVAFKKLGTAFTFMLDKALAPAVDDLSKSLHEMLQDEESIRMMTELFTALGVAVKGVGKAFKFLHNIGAGLGLKAAEIAGFERTIERNKRLFELAKIPQAEKTQAQKAEVINLTLEAEVNNFINPETGETETKIALKNPNTGETAVKTIIKEPGSFIYRSKL
jgi:hypothetical protein